jgi:asparagine synthase (glutamine-hydrolysing)
MCGIAGIVSENRLAADDGRRVVAMRDVLAHRGPDAAGLYQDEQAALGHRRLSIVDLAAGKQPLSNERGSVWISFNGEIYNHGDLRPELEAHGHVYRTRSDTEAIVHAYEQWGADCVHRLRGMFAFAIWDADARRLLLARDRLGIKPLYWTRHGDRLIFASEIKALLASGLVPPEANEPAIPELLSTRSIAGDETLFKGVFKLQPGHVLTFEDGRVTCRRYWDVPIGRDQAAPARSRAEDVRRFRELLEEAIRLRLMSDVPLGVFLSGGIDSSAIAALMARMIDRPLRTFSVAFKARAYNELEYARTVSRAIGAEAHEIVIDDRDFFGALPRLVWHEDEPIAHPSSVPLFFVSKLAREHVTVVLTGEGSDELLAGYGKYPRALLNMRAGAVYSRAVPRRIRAGIARLAGRLPGRAGRVAHRSFLGPGSVEHGADLAFFDGFAGMDLSRQREMLSPRLLPLVNVQRAYGPSMDHFNRAAAVAGAGVLDRLLYADMKTYLVELLMKQDQMSMAASIESRVPFLDHHLVEFAAQLPDDRKLSGFSTKRILREAVADVLPPSILQRPKMGFPVPFAAWARGDWRDVVRDVLLDRRTRERGIVSPSAAERLLQPRDGALSTEALRAKAEAVRTHDADAVWALFNLELWYRTFIDGDGVQTLAAPRAATADAAMPLERQPVSRFPVS